MYTGTLSMYTVHAQDAFQLWLGVLACNCKVTLGSAATN